MKKHTSTIVKRIDSKIDTNDWNRLSSHPIVGSMYQCKQWAEPLEKYGVQNSVIGVWKHSQLVGGGLFRSIPIPYTGVSRTTCLEGPIFLEWEPEWADAFVSEIAKIASDVNSMEVAIINCHQGNIHYDLISAFNRARLRIKVRWEVPEAIVDLAGKTGSDIWDKFHKGTKRSIRKARKKSIVVKRLTKDEDLNRAYFAWQATMLRKNFTNIRPWSSLRPFIKYCVTNRLGSVYASFHRDKLLAASFVVEIGQAARYVYGGYIDHCEHYQPNHILHYEAIHNCIANNMKEYNLGNLVLADGIKKTGLNQFKFGFNALPREQSKRIVWERKPLIIQITKKMKRSRNGKKLIAFLRQRLIKRGL